MMLPLGHMMRIIAQALILGALNAHFISLLATGIHAACFLRQPYIELGISLRFQRAHYY